MTLKCNVGIHIEATFPPLTHPSGLALLTQNIEWQQSTGHFQLDGVV